MTTRAERNITILMGHYEEILQRIKKQERDILYQESNEEKPDSIWYRFIGSHENKNELVKNLREDGYQIIESIRCWNLDCDCDCDCDPDPDRDLDHNNSHHSTICKNTLWLSISRDKKLKFTNMGALNKEVKKRFNSIEQMMLNENINEINFPLPTNLTIESNSSETLSNVQMMMNSDIILKEKLIEILEKNKYSVEEYKQICKYHHDLNINDSKQSSVCNSDNISCRTIRHTKSECTPGNWLSIRNTSQRLIEKIVDKLVVNIITQMCRSDIIYPMNTLQIPLKQGVKEMLVQKLLTYEFELTYFKENIYSHDIKCHCNIECMTIRERE